MVMGDVLCECATEMAFADRDDPIEAFGLNRSYEAFGMRVGIRRASGRLQDVNARVAEPLADLAAPLAVAIANHHAMGNEEAFLGCQRSDHLPHKHFVGPRRRAREHDPSGGQIDHEYGVVRD